MHGQGHQRSLKYGTLYPKGGIKIKRSSPKPCTHNDMGRCWVLQRSYPKVRTSQGHSKVKSAQNG